MTNLCAEWLDFFVLQKCHISIWYFHNQTETVSLFSKFRRKVLSHHYIPLVIDLLYNKRNWHLFYHNLNRCKTKAIGLKKVAPIKAPLEVDGHYCWFAIVFLFILMVERLRQQLNLGLERLVFWQPWLTRKPLAIKTNGKTTTNQA